MREPGPWHAYDYLTRRGPGGPAGTLGKPRFWASCARRGGGTR